VNTRFMLRMVRRDARHGFRRFGLHMGAIAIGVAALVAINAFRADVADSIRAQARDLLGADLEISSRAPLPDSLTALLDSAARGGVDIAYVTDFASMALAAPSGHTRLVQVRALEGGFPFYGSITTDPPGLWRGFRTGPQALVDPGALIQLAAHVGDTLHLGDTAFTIAGVVRNYPGDVGLRAALGPRVFIPARYLAATHLLERGSRVGYAAYLRFSTPAALDQFIASHHDEIRSRAVRYTTADARERDLTRGLDYLGRYLGLVGLAALLLGGVGVASAVRLFVEERIESAAVLRCLGARQGTVFAIYVAQAALLGLAGSTAGAALGVGVQLLLPRVLRGVLPLDVSVRVHPGVIVTGIAVGVAVAVIFALLPLLRIRNVPPLRAIRRDLAETRDRWRVVVYAALAAGLLLLARWQAPNLRSALGFAVAIGGTGLVLWLAALALIRVTRRAVPRSARYEVRQGIANLFRPRNQTVAVTLALGFGIFLVATLYVVQTNLVRRLSMDTGADRPNLVAFDVQTDELVGVKQLLVTHALPLLDVVPIVPARIAAIDGVPVDSVLAARGPRHRGRWAFTREYRNTYRDTLVNSEQVVAGHWWSNAPADTTGPAQVSLEEGVAEDLGLTLGSRVTWNVQGVRVPTVVTSLRTVNWARFEPNFFAVFQPRALAGAPQTFVVLTRAPNEDVGAAFQTDLVRRYPNVSALDLGLVERTLDAVLDKVTLAIRFMALFSIASGILILIGAVAASRRQRMMETVLLKTLGASTRQVRLVLRTEYAALGLLAAVVGIGLATLGAWAAMHFLFTLSFAPPVLGLVLFAAAAAALTTAVGMLAGRETLRRPPLEALRRLSE